MFNEFWRIYGKKINKPMARAKFDAITSPAGLETVVVDNAGNRHRITLQASPEEIVEAAKAQRMTWLNEDTPEQFRPHPVTWLNQGRFEDFDEDERAELAAQWDRHCGVQERLYAQGKLKVVG